MDGSAASLSKTNSTRGHVRIICVARCSAPVKGGLIEIRKRRAGLQTFDQIRVCDERTAKREQIGVAPGEPGICQIHVVTVICDVGILEPAAQSIEVEWSIVARAAGSPLDNVQIHEFQSIELVGQVLKLRLRIATKNARGAGDWRDANAGAIGTDFPR